MICPLTDAGYCHRHACYHRGPLKAIALDPGPEGERHRALWDANASRRPEVAAIAKLRQATCRHLGNPTGEAVGCQSCSGKVALKVFECSVHGSCTIGRAVAGRACCANCPDKRMPASAQIVVTADGIGDHIRGLAVAQAWKEANPGSELVYVAKPWVKAWCELFGGYDRLATSPIPEVAAAWAAGNNAGWHFIEAAAAAPSMAPGLKPLPQEAIDWAEHFRGATVLAPFTLAPNRGRDWLLSHWRVLEEMLCTRCVVIGAASDKGKSEKSGVLFESCELYGESPARVAALMLVARRVISNESGMAHVAGALGVPTIVLAAQLDALPIYAVWPSVNVIQGPLECSGCRWSGRHFHPRCNTHCASLQSITPHQVLEAIERQAAGIAGDVALMLGRLCTKAPNVAPVEVADRRPTMGKFLLHLAELDKPLVVETGCQRADDDYGAGMSTQIFGRFLARRGGRLLSIDNNGRNVNFARSRTQGLPVDVIREDSVAWLSKFDWPQADGVYLDSADVGEPGYQEHCLREAQAASTRAKAQFMLIDDTVKTKHGWWGKGALAVPWLQANGWEIEEAGYQVLLRRAS